MSGIVDQVSMHACIHASMHAPWAWPSPPHLHQSMLSHTHPRSPTQPPPAQQAAVCGGGGTRVHWMSRTVILPKKSFLGCECNENRLASTPDAGLQDHAQGGGHLWPARRRRAPVLPRRGPRPACMTPMHGTSDRRMVRLLRPQACAIALQRTRTCVPYSGGTPGRCMADAAQAAWLWRDNGSAMESMPKSRCRRRVCCNMMCACRRAPQSQFPEHAAVSFVAQMPRWRVRRCAAERSARGGGSCRSEPRRRKLRAPAAC